MVADATDAAPRASVVKTGAMATLILAWEGFGDLTVSLALVASALVVSPIALFGITFVMYAALELWFCTWIDGNWALWYAKAGPRVQEKVEKWRGEGLMGRAVDKITSGSTRGYAIAAILASPVIVVTIARAVGGRTVGKARVVWVSLAYSATMASIVTLLGAAVRAGENAL